MKRTVLVLWGMTATLTWAGEYEAIVRYARTAELGLAVSGIVETVTVEPGARVAKGQLLLALEATPFEAEATRAEAALARASADVKETTRDYKQAEDLYERTVLSTVELENARLRMERTEAEHKAATARLKQARYELARSRLTAPFDGRVLAVRVQPGEAVVSRLEAKPLVTLAAEGEYVAQASLPGPAAPGLEPGQKAAVEIGGSRYEGQVRSIGVAERGGTEVAVAFRGNESVRVGQTARIVLP